MALRLRELGHARAFALTGGIGAWEEAGMPLQQLLRGDPKQNADQHQPM